MQFGLLYEAQRPFEGTTVDWNTLYKETLEQCVLADKMGFDNLWFVEHHFLTGFSGSPCPEVMFGALSQLTKRIRIGFGVCILPYHHPVRVAERVAMLDQLTDGRIELGTGRSNAYEQIGPGDRPAGHARDVGGVDHHAPAASGSRTSSPGRASSGRCRPRRVLPKPYPEAASAACISPARRPTASTWRPTRASACCPRPRTPRPSSPSTSSATGRGSSRRRPWAPCVNEFWGNNVHAFCGEDNREARELARAVAQDVLRPGQALHPRPHQRLRGAAGVVGRRARPPEGRLRPLAAAVRRGAPGSRPRRSASRSTAVRARRARPSARWIPTRCAIAASSSPAIRSSCIKGVQLYEEAGVDQVILIMQTETIPHEQVLQSIEMFGKHVIPACRTETRAKPVPAGAR